MDVFLSYASEDRPLAERVCRVLEAEGTIRPRRGRYYSDEQLYVPLSPATRFINVRVVYVDGSMDTQRVDIGTGR